MDKKNIKILLLLPSTWWKKKPKQQHYFSPLVIGTVYQILYNASSDFAKKPQIIKKNCVLSSRFDIIIILNAAAFCQQGVNTLVVFC